MEYCGVMWNIVEYCGILCPEYIMSVNRFCLDA